MPLEKFMGKGGAKIRIPSKSICLKISFVFRFLFTFIVQSDLMTRKILFLPLLIFIFSSSYGNYWVQKADFGGAPRADAAGCSVGSKGYIGTGYVSGTGYTKDWWEYDPVTNTWLQRADYGGSPIVEAACFSIGSVAYILPAPTGNDFWEFDPALNAWTQKAAFAGSARQAAVAFSINSKGYICSGAAPSLGNSMNDLWEYDPALNNWTQKTNLAGATRHYAAGFSIGNKGYIGTGYSSVTSGNLSDFWEWDAITDTWTQKATFTGGARNEGTGFSIGSYGYLGTGYMPGPMQDFWQYNPVTNSWVQKANFSGGGRVENVSFSVGALGYLGTGWDGTNFRKDFWEYHPDSTVSVNEHVKAEAGIRIYPNPFSSAATVSIQGMNENNNYELVIFDMSGKRVRAEKPAAAETKITRENLESGNYLIRVFTGSDVVASAGIVVTD